MADLSPIMTLFREFEVKYRQAGDMSFEEEKASGLLDECSGLEKQIMALPVSSAQDLAAKLIANTRYGDFTPDDVGTGGLIDQALAILAVREHPDAKLIELGVAFDEHAATYRKARKDSLSGKATSERWNAECDVLIRLFDTIKTHRPATLQGVAVKATAIAFDAGSSYGFAEENDGDDLEILKFVDEIRVAAGMAPICFQEGGAS